MRQCCWIIVVLGIWLIWLCAYGFECCFENLCLMELIELTSILHNVVSRLWSEKDFKNLNTKLMTMPNAQKKYWFSLQNKGKHAQFWSSSAGYIFSVLWCQLKKITLKTGNDRGIIQKEATSYIVVFKIVYKLLICPLCQQTFKIILHT